MIRYGIVGCAGIGPIHAEAVAAASGAELVACADLDADAADSFAADHDCAAYTDTGEMIVDADVDAVSVCTPSGTHADVTVEAARAGAHVLCEKPLDIFADRLDRMLSVCEEEGVTLAGVFQKRTTESARWAKRAVEDGEIGDLVFGTARVKWFRSQSYYDSGDWRGTRELDGGSLLNQAIHAIDTLQWVAGGVESVQAMTDTLARDIDVEDTAAIALRFENGALGTIEASVATKGGNDGVELNGTDGSIAFTEDEISSFRVGNGVEEPFHAETETVDADVVAQEWGEGHAVVVQDFVDAIHEGREPMVTGREARAAVDVILAAYESAERGERVAVEEIRGD
jgi:predicted dehydrogenase